MDAMRRPGQWLLLTSLLLTESVFVARVTPAQSVDVPEWAKEAVWYQIFPERFRNGDPKNDPTPDDIRGAWPHVIPEGWRISDWTGDWYAQAEWERVTGKDRVMSGKWCATRSRMSRRCWTTQAWSFGCQPVRHESGYGNEIHQQACRFPNNI